MTVRARATIEDLYRVKEKAELVNGAVVVMSPTGYLPGHAASAILISLWDYARRTGTGHAIGDGVGFIVDLPNRQSFCPDVAYHTGNPTGMKFLEGAPVFAVEVRSEGDYGPSAERAMAEKRRDYFAAGTLVVWDVDLLSESVVRSYRASDPETPLVYRRGDVAFAEPAAPGWEIRVDELFPDR
jgi:Uma2 family endonuclease